MSDSPLNLSEAAPKVPRHVAIIMDGNGRWAKQRKKIRTFGHKAGVDALRKVVRHCGELGVEVLTVFAFSSENWSRPKTEVSVLMELFAVSLQREIKGLMEEGVRLRFIGDRSAFSASLRKRIAASEAATAENTRLTFNIAANYGGRWDITQAARKLAAAVHTGDLNVDDIDEDMLGAQMALSAFPEPDLFIRTGGEQRISNYLLWNLAYSELYFTDVLWPDFDATEFDKACAAFGRRQRRFGKTGDQVEADQSDTDGSATGANAALTEVSRA